MPLCISVFEKEMREKKENDSEGENGLLDYICRPRRATENKRSWPEVVGLFPGEAKRKIKRDMPTAHIEVVHGFCTLDLRKGRVRLYISKFSGKVSRTPVIG
ncbi:hypothetical protein RHSIM_RhsimUnG0178500 [Rhododendron simsii]|uniref:Uncharacterized protein n=1 Tax=Rhododendron simsii TaxID=118357 RepID=A0A834FW63_RHOSS|nr:hypothetical protein RHSIM_RhsimUnG0178500 [Rhododendron simsii]